MASLSFRVIDISNLGEQSSAWDDVNFQMDSFLDAEKLSILVGSGISQYAPCSVPYAGEITHFLTSRLMGALPAGPHVGEPGSTLGVPFEVLMARLAELRVKVARDAALILTQAGRPNPLHQHLAALLQRCAEEGKRLALITTNYDTGISCAIEERRQLGQWPSRLPEPRIIARPEHLRPDQAQLEIFHIHGITTDPSTLVLDYKEEFSLPDWKTRYLGSLLEDSNLLVIGFSGWDLDISKALARCRLSSIIWLRRDPRECVEWSPDATRLLKSCSVTTVNTGGDLRYSLCSLAKTGPKPLERNDVEVNRRFAELEAKYGGEREPWFRVWARWTVLRAGYAQLGGSISPEEAALLSKDQLLEMQAFGCFYSGRHATGARFQRQAAQVVRKQDLGRYIYFRNNEVEFLNRGAYTAKALVAAVTTFIILLPQVFRRRRWSPAASVELRNLFSSLFLVWPLLSIFRHSLLWRRLGPPVVSALARIVRGADLDKYQNFLSASPDSVRLAEAEAHYRWLGQGARLINWYRFNALQKLRQGYRSRSSDMLLEAHRLAELALLEAGRIDDPCRLAKCQLVLAETIRQLEACSDDPRPQTDGSGGEVMAGQTTSGLVDAAWHHIAEAEVWKPYYVLAHSVYKVASRTGGRWPGRLRILALALLETS